MMNSERPIDFPNFKKRLIGAFYEGRPPARCGARQFSPIPPRRRIRNRSMIGVSAAKKTMSLYIAE